MAQTQAEILDQIQSPKESQTQSLQATTIDDPGIKGESSIETSNSSNSISLMNSAKSIGTSNMAGAVDGGMNNIYTTNNFHIYPPGDASLAMAQMYPNESGSNNHVAIDACKKCLKELRNRRPSHTEVSLGTRTENVKSIPTLTEDTDNSQISNITQTVQPNRDMNATDDVDGVEGNDECVIGLKGGIKLEVGTATAPESEPRKEINSASDKCSTTDDLQTCLASPMSRDEDEPTPPSAIACSPSIEMNPASEFFKKGPGNTVAEAHRQAYSPDKDRIAGGSLTHFNAMWNELAKMGYQKRSRVEVIFKQLVILAERLPKSEMIKISEYFLTCMGGDGIDQGVDLEALVPNNVISLTDFKELEKKLRLLDDFILNCDFHNILYIAKHRSHMLLEIMKHLNSFRDDDDDGGSWWWWFMVVVDG